MSYAFERNESLREGLRRIAREQLDEARQAGAEGGHEAVHEIRKRGKKVRALLRLVRGCEPELYERENAAIRDLARPLSPIRDAHALVELIDTHGESLDGSVRDALREALVRRRDERWSSLDGEARVRRAVKAVAEARERSRRWPLRETGWKAFRGGLMKTYARGRDRLKGLGKSPPLEALHDWRKRAKYHRHHVDLLREAWAPTFEAREQQVHRLTDLLGDDQDLARLARVVTEEQLLDDDGRETIGAWAADARADRVDQARRLGDRIYAEKPEAIAQRFGRIWTA